MCWKYRNKCLEKPPKGYYGFVYEITDPNGVCYIGSKAFRHVRKRKLSKKDKKATGKRIERKEVDSGWINYWGSSKLLLSVLSSQEEQRNGFSRRILKFARDKTSLRYWEAAYQFKLGVLFLKNSYNSNIMGKFFRGKVHK